jgi:hypothetical protein
VWLVQVIIVVKLVFVVIKQQLKLKIVQLVVVFFVKFIFK